MTSVSSSVFSAGVCASWSAWDEVNSEKGAEKSSKMISIGITSTSWTGSFCLSFSTGLAMPLGSGSIEIGNTSSVSTSWVEVAFAEDVAVSSAGFRLASAYALAMNAAARAKTAASFCCEVVVSVVFPSFSGCCISAGAVSFSSVASASVVFASSVASATAGNSSIPSAAMLSSVIVAVSSGSCEVVSGLSDSSSGLSVWSAPVWNSSSVSVASEDSSFSVTSDW